MFDSTTILGVSTRGTIWFGTGDIRSEGWDGTFPVDIVRCDEKCGTLQRRIVHTCRKATTVERWVRAAQRGAVVGATASWVELVAAIGPGRVVAWTHPIDAQDAEWRGTVLWTNGENVGIEWTTSRGDVDRGRVRVDTVKLA